jgi:hypothetical protein
MLRWISLLLILFAVNAYANCTVVVGQPTGVAPACTTVFQSCTTETNAADSAVGSTYTKKAWKFQASETTTICKIEIWAKEVGAMTNTVTVSIRNDNSGNPGTLVGDASSATDVSGWGTSYGYRAFTLSAGITATNEYWVQVETSGADGSNYIDMRASNACDYEEGIRYYTDNWYNSNADSGIISKMYK